MMCILPGMELRVQPHPIISDLIGAIEYGDPANVDIIVEQTNGLLNRTHSYCWVHHEVEPARAGHCRECAHGWDTVEQLIDEDFAAASRLWPDQAVRAPHHNQVFVCPACTHDL